jgi:hypothetical protein
MTAVPGLIALVILTPAFSASERSAPHSITGRVVDSADHGVPRLAVQAIHDNAEHTGRAHALTREDGTFELEVFGDTPLNVVVGSKKTGFAFQAGLKPGARDVILRLVGRQEELTPLRQ